MYASAFVLGFHGCDESVGERVLAGKEHLKPSANDYDWLGHGIYFWENSPARARHWAESMSRHSPDKRNRITKPFVLGAIINLGNCLDLTEAHSLSVVRNGFGAMKEVYELLLLDLPTNEPAKADDTDLLKRKLDCAVINYVHSMREDYADQDSLKPFDSVRGVFSEGGPLYEGSKFMAKTHIQVCVRRSSSIFGYFRPIDR